MALNNDLIMRFVRATKSSTSAKDEMTVYGTIKESDGVKYVQFDGSEIYTPVVATSDAKHGDRVTVMIKNHTATVTGNLSSPSARLTEVESLAGNVNEIKVGKLDAKTAQMTYATIESLEATDAKVENFDATYANIDFSNIGEAAIEYLYAQSGLIKDVTVSNGTITGELVGVTIRGDRLIGNTIIADKLVIKGSDGLFYKLNTDGMKVEAEQTSQNSLNGSVILAKSITATKISVDDLVAFDATIGGFNITANSLYSGVKSSVSNTTRGIYLDKDGQLAVGDSSNYLKYYKDTDGSYKLAISAKSISVSSGVDLETAVEDFQKLEIGGRNLILKSTIKPPAANPTDRRWTCYGVESKYAENYKDGFCAAHAVARWNGIQVFLNPLVNNVNPGDQVTFSVTATNTANAPSRICFYLMQYDKAGTRVYVADVDEYLITEMPSGETRRVSYTHTFDQATIDLIKSGGNVRITLQLNFADEYSTYFYAPKLERGSKATDWTPAPEDTASDIETAIGAVEIGSRNLLRNTKTFNASSGHSALQSDTYKNFSIRYLDCTSVATNTYRDFSQFSGALEPEPGSQYTLSFYAKGTGIATYLYDGSYGTTKSITSQGVTSTKRDGHVEFSLSDTWKRYWVTYTLETTNTLGTTGNKSVLFRLFGGHKAYICGCKLEKSNKPTDWTPAPEDVDSDISNASKTATNFLSYDSSNGLQLGNKTGGSWSGFRTQITSTAFNILNSAGTVLASYGEKLIELGKNATDAVIKLCGGKGQIEYVTDEDTGVNYLQLVANKLRLKSSEMSSLYSMFTNNSTRWEKSAVNVSPTKVEMYASKCIDPTLVEKVEGWNTTEFTMNPDSIDLNTPGTISITDKNGTVQSFTEGTSGIWTYRKWANGMVELWGSYTVSNLACTTALGGMYQTAVFTTSTFPFTVYNPNLTASYESDGYGAFLWATTTTTTTKAPSYYLVRPTSATIASGKINFHVRGRWKT